MFLTTGLAALTALWFSIYILLSTTFRLWANTPPLSETWVDGIKRFAYRLSRALLVVNTVLVPSLILDVVVKANEFRGGEGLISVIGGGLACEWFQVSAYKLPRPLGVPWKWKAQETPRPDVWSR